MKNSKSILAIIMATILLCSIFVACAKNNDETVDKDISVADTSNTYETVATSNENTEVQTSTTEKATETTIKGKTTTTKQAVTTIKKSVTTIKKAVATTKKKVTTKKVTTTKKQTTTKKVTTTEEEWDCNVDGHSCKVGPIGWVNSYAEAQKKALRYIDDHADSGGFRVAHCYWCDKYTAYVTLD